MRVRHSRKPIQLPRPFVAVYAGQLNWLAGGRSVVLASTYAVHMRYICGSVLVLAGGRSVVLASTYAGAYAVHMRVGTGACDTATGQYICGCICGKYAGRYWCLRHSNDTYAGAP
jgi:hypothetical protein